MTEVEHGQELMVDHRMMMEMKDDGQKPF